MLDELSHTLTGDRIHHALVLGGPEGIGKATLAYRIARWMLAEPADRRPDLDVDEHSRAAGMIARGSHPNLLVSQRPYDAKRKKHMTVIPVDEIRRVNHFFESSAAMDGWRIAIIDSAEDMNRQAANALLKTLEEPPEKALFIIVSHMPGRLLPTIRSRCRMIVMPALDDAAVGEGVDRLAGPLDAETRAMAVALSGGSLRMALQLTSPAGREIRAVRTALDRLPRRDGGELHALADSFARAGGEKPFALALSIVRDWLSAQMRRRAPAGDPAALARFAEVWDKVDALARDTESLNLDRRQAFLVAFVLLEDLMQSAR